MRLFAAINFGTFMQRRSPRINEKDECEKNMDGLSYFKHVAIVALDFPTNPEAKKSADIRGMREGIGIAKDFRVGVSRYIGFIFVAEVKSSIRMARRRMSHLSLTFRDRASKLEPAWQMDGRDAVKARLN